MKIIQRIKNLFLSEGKQSDGYHTFDELYDHRVALFVELCFVHKDRAWWSWNHSDGSPAFGYPWIIMGINYFSGNQITYHINTKKYKSFEKIIDCITELKFAPEYDGHTPEDVVSRLRSGFYKRKKYYKKLDL